MCAEHHHWILQQPAHVLYSGGLHDSLATAGMRDYHGYIISPILFFLAFEVILRGARQVVRGIKLLSGERLPPLRSYMDDQWIKPLRSLGRLYTTDLI